jgi:hypothetical protein
MDFIGKEEHHDSAHIILVLIFSIYHDFLLLHASFEKED